MSKIICEVCGASYSDSEASCPICGTAKPEDMEVLEETVESAPKSHRASDSHRRNRTSKSAGVDSSNKMLVIIAAVLAVAIIVVGVFCLATCSGCTSCAGDNNDTNPSDTGESTNVITEPKVPATNVVLGSVTDKDGNAILDEDGNDLYPASSVKNGLTITDIDSSFKLVARVYPAVCDEVMIYTYESSDSSVAYVDADGVIYPASNGKATITVYAQAAYYGTYFTFSVDVTCKMEGFEPMLELTMTDISLGGSNPTSFDMYNYVRNSDLFDKSKFSLETDDTGIVSVDGTKVVAVANGTANVTMYYAKDTEYEQSEEFIVRVSGVNGGAETSTYSLRTNYGVSTEATITLSDSSSSNSFRLYLVDGNDNTVTGVSWTYSDGFTNYATSNDNGDGTVTITGKSSTQGLTGKCVYIYATYENTQYTYKLIVNP